MHIIVYLLIALILFNLISGLVFLVRDRGQGERTVRALTWRIGLSIGLFLLLMLAYWSGIVSPNGS